jgi:uncharacterized membrane protein YcjF (UPF0283 family)
MTKEYIVLGGILMVMGAVQTWLRHGPEGRKLRAEQEAVRERRLKDAEAVRAEMDAEDDEADSRSDGGAAAAERRRRYESDMKAFKRTKRLWTGWTAILGGVAIVIGIALVIWGILGY